jgi:hypothetical protein
MTNFYRLFNIYAATQNLRLIEAAGATYRDAVSAALSRSPNRAAVLFFEDFSSDENQSAVHLRKASSHQIACKQNNRGMIEAIDSVHRPLRCHGEMLLSITLRKFSDVAFRCQNR